MLYNIVNSKITIITGNQKQESKKMAYMNQEKKKKIAELLKKENV